MSSEQSAEQVFTQLEKRTHKFITINRRQNYVDYAVKQLFGAGKNATWTRLIPTEQERVSQFFRDHQLHFFSSAMQPFSQGQKPQWWRNFYQGWTVTYVALELLYHLNCRNVYVVGMDHSFAQVGRPNQVQNFTGDDHNHFDKNYFKGHQWQLADLPMSEKYYRVARKKYEEDGRNVWDATIGGRCTIFKKHPEI